MWQAIERMMNCIFRSVVMCYIYYVYTKEIKVQFINNQNCTFIF